MPADPRPGDPFTGDGELRALARAKDWSATPLGPVEQWPQALQTLVRTSMDSPFPTCLWCGPDLNLVYNDAYRAVLGAKHPWALGTPGSEVWGEIWDEISPLFERIRSGGDPIYAEDAPFVIRRTGETAADYPQNTPNAWFTFSLSSVRDENDQILGFLNIVSETTDRRLAEREMEMAKARAEQAESRLRDIFKQAPSFMAVLHGPDLVFEYVNQAYSELVGSRKLVGLPVFEALPEVRGQGFEDILRRVVETGTAFVGREVPVFISRPPGSEPEERFLDFVYYPIVEADGTRSGVVAHGSDVTDHVRARREAQRARLEAEEANRAKSQFLANMSHEIRTPINAIIGYTDLLEMAIAGPLTEGQKTQLARVRTSSRHLLMLIEDILDLSKVEAGRMSVHQDRSLAVKTIAAAIALVGPQAEQRGIQVKDPCADDTSTFYVGDEDRVRQVLVNLLSNAVKFTESGGSIIVDCGTVEPSHPERSASDEERLTYIRVRDTGIGIAPDELARIFKPFTQVERGHTRTRGGTGLGLTISRKLAQLMGGDLTVESELGKGSTFTLWLPSDVASAPPLEEIVTERTEKRPRHLKLVGEALQREIQPILGAFRQRLKRDPLIPMAVDIRDPDLEDHASTLLTDLAQSLIVLDGSDGSSERLLQDGSEIQRVIAELHGQQRAKLGWTAEALAREWEILAEEIAAAVQKRMPRTTRVDGALDLLERVLARAEMISRRSLRRTA